MTVFLEMTHEFRRSARGNRRRRKRGIPGHGALTRQSVQSNAWQVAHVKRGSGFTRRRGCASTKSVPIGFKTERTFLLTRLLGTTLFTRALPDIDQIASIERSLQMKKMLVTAAALTMMCGVAFAQIGGPAPQSDNMNRPGSTSGRMNDGTGATGATTPGATSGTTGTTGMSSGGTAHDGMNRNTSSDTMKKQGTSR